MVQTNGKLNKMVAIKYGRSGVRTGDLSLRQILKVGDLSRVEANSNSAYFFIGSYTNNSRSGEFLTNSKAGSSYSPKFGGHLVLTIGNMNFKRFSIPMCSIFRCLVFEPPLYSDSHCNCIFLRFANQHRHLILWNGCFHS